MGGGPNGKDVFVNIVFWMMLKIEYSFLLIFHSQKDKGAWNLRNPVLFRKNTPEIGIGDVVDWIE